MEQLGERPVWSMSGAEMLSTLDALDAELARLQTYRLHVIAGLEDVGYAEEIGAHDTAQLLAFRYRLDRPEARRDVRLARNLAKYDAVATALPSVDVPSSADGVRLRPAQADAIVSALERVPATVPIENVDVAEQELVGLARHLSPGELRRAGQRVRDLLDTDGPEPAENKAYARETLTLSTADRGVKFHGYLANENAELLRSLVHAGGRPHRTVDGELDPRSREKRQCAGPSTPATEAASSAAPHPSCARHTTSSPGSKVVRRRCRTLFSCADATTSTCTPATGRSPSPTASSPSADPPGPIRHHTTAVDQPAEPRRSTVDAWVRTSPRQSP
jgi:hypothetical protein